MKLSPTERSAIILLASGVTASLSYTLTTSLLACGAIIQKCGDGEFYYLIAPWALVEAEYAPRETPPIPPASQDYEEATSYQAWAFENYFSNNSNQNTTASAGGIDDLLKRMRQFKF